jgi:hypothetical protein
MDKIDDGGPAFPSKILKALGDGQGGSYVNTTYGGMSLRDWFAGQALIAMGEPPLVVGKTERADRLAWHAHDAYQIADAMLAARKTEAE